MISIPVQAVGINVGSLDAELRSALAPTQGLTWDGQVVTVVFSDDVTPAQLDLAQTIVRQHDPKRLTPDQQTELDRKSRLEALRGENAAELDLPAYDSASPDIRRLAEKIAWLELEIAALR
ncbi:MAG: hypothetical protein L6Q98_21270 [Anaerolineae bacterium]|nr:hypothetical protein [Anaerolineae bacterium]NUQ06119.1 hypothetical protein [Anaerolineae bacterium]